MATPEPRITGSVDASAWSPPLPEAPGFDHLVVETPGLRTHVAAIGEGEPVVLLHGFPEHWWQWHAVAPVIAAAGYRVICPDLRGAGWTVAEDPRVERGTRLRATCSPSSMPSTSSAPTSSPTGMIFGLNAKKPGGTESCTAVRTRSGWS
jgi:hypothetical protein